MKKASKQSRVSGSVSRASARQTPTRRATNGGRVRRHPLNMQWLRDFVSQMLAVERGGEKLYQRALDELGHEELRDRLESFFDQARRHAELCEQMLEVTGADPDYLSQEAHLAEQKVEGLLSTEADEELRDLNNLENLLLAETKDHWNWETLSGFVPEIEDRELSRTLRKATTEVLRQERDHLKWATDQIAKLTQEMARREEPREEAHEGNPEAIAEERRS